MKEKIMILGKHGYVAVQPYRNTVMAPKGFQSETHYMVGMKSFASIQAVERYLNKL